MNSVSVLCCRIKEYYLNVILTGCENHTKAVYTAELCRLKVGNKTNLLANKLIGCIELSDARNDLALFIAKINLKLKKLLCLRNRLGRKDLCNAKLYRTKGLNADLGLVLRLLYMLVSPFLILY